jgi:hypothetical protein
MKKKLSFVAKLVSFKPDIPCQAFFIPHKLQSNSSFHVGAKQIYYLLNPGV